MQQHTSITIKRLRGIAAAWLAICTLASGALWLAPGAAAVAVVAAPAASGELHDTAARHAQHHADAVQAFLAQRYAVAYGRFAELADAGHAPSALMALAMVCQGRSMFGSDWSATPGQLQRWSAMAAHEVDERGTRIPDHDRGE